jgi:1,4-dihydroxy-2-naphthoate octaprenyltransferase
MVSKAYSNDKIRLKKYAIGSWFIVGIFQGAVTYLIVFQAVNHLVINDLMHISILYPALLSTFMLWAVYPMTQIYQHEEDALRGDFTLSYQLGIRGTFYFTAFVFSIAFLGFFLYLPSRDFVAMTILTLPITLFFGWWFWQVFKDEKQANFKNTMLLNLLASVCLNVFYIWLIVR